MISKEIRTFHAAPAGEDQERIIALMLVEIAAQLAEINAGLSQLTSSVDLIANGIGRI